MDAMIGNRWQSLFYSLAEFVCEKNITFRLKNETFSACILKNPWYNVDIRSKKERKREKKNDNWKNIHVSISPFSLFGRSDGVHWYCRKVHLSTFWW
jgi:hypothetical protein